MNTRTAGYRVGTGFDAHRLVPHRRLVIGGVPIPHHSGLSGHSDADVLLHAITDALLGAAALPDIGSQFPDTDPRYKGIDSALLLGQAFEQVKAKGLAVVNLDCTIVCDEPKLSPFLPAARQRIAELLGIEPDSVGLKAKTTEGTMLAQPGQSIAAIVTLLLVRTQ